MTIYRGVGGVNREIKQQFCGIEGVNREIKEQYRGAGGVNRKVFSNVPAGGLYWNGDECVKLTGGWGIGSGLNPSGWVKQTNYLECTSLHWANYCSNNKIDVTNYSFAYVELDFKTGINSAAFILYITDVNQSGAYASDGNLINEYARFQTTYQRAILSFDISYILGSHWFGIRHANDYGNSKVYKIWLQ